MAAWWLKWRLALSLLLGGALHALSFAPGPLPQWALSFVELLTMAWLVQCVWQAPSAGFAARRAWLFGLANFIVGVYWLTISMHTYGLLPLPLALLALSALSAYLALFGALAAWLAHKLNYRMRPEDRLKPGRLVIAALIWASAWTLSEWLRGTLFTGFGWLNSGYAHVDSWFAGWAGVAGVYGVAFIAAFTAATLAGLVNFNSTDSFRGHQPQRALAGLVALVFVLAGWGLQQHAWTVNAGQPLLVRIVQGNIEQEIKFTPAYIQNTIETHLKLAATPVPAGQNQPKLVLLPETALAIFQHQLSPSMWTAWLALATKQNSTIVMGAALFDRATDTYTNSVIALDRTTPLEALTSGKLSQRYDKHHLVPFGEFVPWGFRWFVDQMSIPLGDFNRGDPQQPPFVINEQQVAPNICYEDLFGEELLPALRAAGGTPSQTGATILANFSNLGWFGDSWAVRQHWQIARMRTLETSRPMLRATNTGISGAIDAKGVTINRLPSQRSAVLDVNVQGQRGLTPYARFGNQPLLFLMLLGLILVWYTTRARSRA